MSRLSLVLVLTMVLVGGCSFLASDTGQNLQDAAAPELCVRAGKAVEGAARPALAARLRKCADVIEALE